MSLLRELETEQKIIEQQIEQLNARLQAIKLLRGEVVISPTPAAAKAQYKKEHIQGEGGKLLAIPSGYSSKLLLVQKVYLALKILGTGDVTAVAAQLKKFDPSEYRDKVYTKKCAANGLFKLNKTGILNKNQKGKQVYYSIK